MNGTVIDKRFEDMLVDADLNLFSLQVKVTRLVMAILSEKNGGLADINLHLAHSPDEEPHIIRCSRVYIDPDDELIKIAETGGEEPIGWDDIDITSQYRIAQHLYTRHLSRSLYRSLSC